MRFVVFPLVLLAACQSGGELEFQHLSTMKARTNGLVLMDDGQAGHGAMVGTTCSFDTLNGWLIEDYDLPTRDDRVLDTLDGAVLGTNGEGVFDVAALTSVPVDAVTEARYTEGGGFAFLAGTRDACAVGTTDWMDGDSRSVSGELCEAPAEAVSVVREDGTVIVGTEQGTVTLDDEGEHDLADAADFVVYDPRTGLVYLAMEGRSIVRAVDLDGHPVWSTDVGGRITALERMGRRGKVVAMIDDDGEARMVVIDGPSGEPEQDLEAPASDVELEVSEDGSTLAVVRPFEVYFYGVSSPDEEPKKRKTLGVEDRQPVFSD